MHPASLACPCRIGGWGPVNPRMAFRDDPEAGKDPFMVKTGERSTRPPLYWIGGLGLSVQAVSFTRRYSVRNLSRSLDRPERTNSLPPLPLLWVPNTPSLQLEAVLLCRSQGQTTFFGSPNL